MRRSSRGTAFCFWVLVLASPAYGAVAGFFGYTTEYPPVYEAKGADFVSRLEVFSAFDPPRKVHRFRRADAEYGVAWDRERGRVEIERNAKPWAFVSVAPLLARVESYLAAHRLASPRHLPQDLLTVESEDPRAHITVYFDDVSGERIQNRVVWHHFRADVFVRVGKP